jgi:hypothetical protein
LSTALNVVNSVCCGASGTESSIVREGDRAIFLIVAAAGVKRGCLLHEIIAPASELVGGEAADLLASERRQDAHPAAIAGVADGSVGAAVARKEAEIVLQRLGHGIARRGCPVARLALHRGIGERQLLRLRKIENVLPIRLAMVVCDHERTVGRAQVIDPVAAVAAVALRNPRAGAAGELSIADE